jgi:hypothetical protein
MGTFAVICPPVATLMFFLLAVLAEMTARRFEPGRPGQYVEVAWFFLLYGIAFGYFLLVLPAAIAGFIVGRWQTVRGRVRWWLALIIGVAVGAGVQLAIGDWLLPMRGAANYLAGQELIPVAAFALATMAAWALGRNSYNASPDVGATP